MKSDNQANIFDFCYEGENKRIDVAVFEYFKKSAIPFSRATIQKAIINQNVFLNNNKVCKKNALVKNDDMIQIEIVEFDFEELIPKKIDFKIIYEDNDIIVIDKPNNLVVHPGSGNYTDTLVNGLLYYCKEIKKIKEKIRPGIVHRIDKQTTGLLVVCKNELALAKMSDDFKNRKVYKEYLALVTGEIETDIGTINAPIGRDPINRKKMCVTHINSKEAITKFEVVERFVNYTLVKVNILTGRTHQIRVHFQYINHPVLGDPLYSNRASKNSKFGQYLHAHKLEFNHPTSNKKMSFISDIYGEFNDKIKLLRNELI